MTCPHCGNNKWQYEWDERARQYAVVERPVVYGTTRFGKKVRLWNCCRGPA